MAPKAVHRCGELKPRGSDGLSFLTIMSQMLEPCSPVCGQNQDWRCVCVCVCAFNAFRGAAHYVRAGPRGAPGARPWRANGQHKCRCVAASRRHGACKAERGAEGHRPMLGMRGSHRVIVEQRDSNMRSGTHTVHNAQSNPGRLRIQGDKCRTPPGRCTQQGDNPL